MNTTIQILILILVLAALLVLFGLTRNVRTINRRVKKVMSNQAEFDRDLQEAKDEIVNVGNAILAETQQIANWIAQQPGSVDTSGIRGVTASLKALGLKVKEIFEPAVEGSGSEGSGGEGSGTEGSDAEGSGAEGSGTEGSGSEGSGTEGSGSGVE